MLGSQPAFGLIKLCDPARRQQERLQQRRLTILVQVRLGIGDRLGNEPAETGRVLFVAAAGRRDNHPVCCGKSVDERTAG